MSKMKRFTVHSIHSKLSLNVTILMINCKPLNLTKLGLWSSQVIYIVGKSIRIYSKPWNVTPLCLDQSEE